MNPRPLAVTCLSEVLGTFLLIFFGWRGTVIPTSPFSAAGPRAGDFRAAEGSLQAMNVRVPPSRPRLRPSRPVRKQLVKKCLPGISMGCGSPLRLSTDCQPARRPTLAARTGRS